MPMHNPAIREALERSAKAVALRPAIGQKTGRTMVRLKPGLECEVTDGPWTLTVGMGPASGGTNAGPGPGTLGRGALGSCLAIGYAMWAARLGVEIEALEVEVQADYDTRGELGVSDEIPPGYTQIRYVVTVTSHAPEEEVRRVVDTADKYSPYRDVFVRANDVRRELKIVPVE
jgi:uncharacterized OsmC-like protein